MEVQRLGNLATFGLPHRNVEEITIDGFAIPRDSNIVANLYAMHMDGRWWENPDEFEPTRFLDENWKPFKPEAFMPFSTGKAAFSLFMFD